jgi:ATP-dependent Zn protease
MLGVLDEELEQTHSHVVGWLAGIEAEKLFCDELLPNTGHDIQTARAVAALIVREVSDIDSYIDAARTETRALLTDHATAVLAVADALVEHRTISGDMIDRIIREV